MVKVYIRKTCNVCACCHAPPNAIPSTQNIVVVFVTSLETEKD